MEKEKEKKGKKERNPKIGRKCKKRKGRNLGWVITSILLYDLLFHIYKKPLKIFFLYFQFYV